MSTHAAHIERASGFIADDNGEKQAELEVAFEAIANCEAAAVEIRGDVATGKSQALLGRTLHLLQSGVPATSLFVVCSTLDAARELEVRFMSLCRAEAPSRLGAPTFCTPTELMRIHLGSAKTGNAAKRAPRVLLDVELKLLVQDLLARGFDQAAIRQALNAYRVSPGNFDDTARCSHGNDAEAHRALQRALKARGVILREDLPHLCATSDGEPAFPYLFIDDADALPPAVLATLIALAGTQCMVTCSSSCMHGESTCFDLGGLNNDSDAGVLAAAFKSQAEPQRANAWRLPPRGDGSAITVKWRDPREESEGIASYLQRMLREDGTLIARDVYIAVPNDMWADSMKRALHRRFLESSVALSGQSVSGDPRSGRSGARLQALTRLSLIVNPLDAASWRNFCAFGKRDFASDDWNQLEDWSHSQGMSLAEAISKAIADGAERPTLPEAPKVAKDLMGFIVSTVEELSQLKGKRGFALAKAAGEGLDAGELDGFFNSVAGDEDATTLCAHLWSSAFEESFDPSLSKVRIGRLERMAGLSPRILIVAGFNEGLYEADPPLVARRLHAATGKARDLVMLSFVQKMEHEVAAEIGCSIRRSRNERGVRMAMLAPCPLLSRIGDFAPGQQSGQQLLGELTARAPRQHGHRR
ncbi:MAG: hypothetical protein IJO87_05015 [Eggerthellaceae bacterium]|nr:hypothetical protein [Eggerthellaceae bacterium]